MDEIVLSGKRYTKSYQVYSSLCSQTFLEVAVTIKFKPC